MTVRLRTHLERLKLPKARDDRHNSRKGLYDGTWQKVRRMKMRRSPLCERCAGAGKTVKGDVVHHIVPVNENPSLRLALDNLETLCNRCHNRHHKG